MMVTARKIKTCQNNKRLFKIAFSGHLTSTIFSASGSACHPLILTPATWTGQTRYCDSWRNQINQSFRSSVIQLQVSPRVIEWVREFESGRDEFML